MVKARVLFNGEDLTNGKGTLISLNDVREIEAQKGFTVVIMLQ